MFLKKYRPDIIFLQEIDMYTKRAYYRNQLYTLSKYTGLTFRAMGTNIKYKNGFYGDGILSKFPIEYSANYLSPLTNASHEQRGILCNKVSFGNTKINVFSQATQNDINSQLEAYKNKGMQTINDTYNPLLENLKTDIASRFGNLNNSVFFDNLNSIEKNRANAISDLAQDIEAQRSDLFNNELSKRYNYLNFMNDLQNQITDNILNYLGVAQENSSSGTAYNQNLANFQHDKMQDIFNNLIKMANTVLQYKKYM